MAIDRRAQVVHDALPDLVREQRLVDAERAGDDGDRDHRAGGDRQLGRVVLADRLQHAPEQEGGEDAEARRQDDQRQDGAQPQLVRREQAADSAEIRPAKRGVGGTLSGRWEEWKNIPMERG